MPRLKPQPDGPLPDAPSGNGCSFERDREWLILRWRVGSWPTFLACLFAAMLVAAMAAIFIAHTRTASNPPARQAAGELTIIALTTPFVLACLLGAASWLPATNSVSFSSTEARFIRHLGPLRRTRYIPLAECRRLRVLERPATLVDKDGTVEPPGPGRLAFDAGDRTILMAPSLSDPEAHAIFRYLIHHIPRFAESHEPS